MIRLMVGKELRKMVAGTTMLRMGTGMPRMLEGMRGLRIVEGKGKWKVEGKGSSTKV